MSIKHACPDCGALHRKREGVDAGERARTAARARWNNNRGDGGMETHGVAPREVAPAGDGERDKSSVQVSSPAPPTTIEYETLEVAETEQRSGRRIPAAPRAVSVAKKGIPDSVVAANSNAAMIDFVKKYGGGKLK